MLRGGCPENVGMERDYWGSCIVIVGRHTTAGMPPFSFAPLPQICPLQGRSTKSGPICSVARQPEPAADRGNPRQHSAGGEIDRRFPLVPPVCAQGFLVMLRYIVRIEVAHIGNTILTYAEKGVYCTHKRHMSEKEGEHAKTMQTQARLRYAWLQALWADGWRCGIRAATHCADGR